MTRSSMPRLRGRNAKIVATLGPGSRAPHTIRLLAEAGADIFRLNFSHGSHEDHKASLEGVRAAESALGRPLAVLADLQGPKVRVGSFPGGKISLSMRGEYPLVAGKTTQDVDTIPVPHPEILEGLEVGDRILCDDGKVILEVVEAGARPRVRSPLPAELSDKKGFTVQGKALPVSALTDKDRIDLDYALSLGVDLVALSFVQTVEDIHAIKAIVQGRAQIVAKLEKPAAIHNLQAICKATDAVMVARGDLGVEFPTEEVPIIQRLIVRTARGLGRPVIVATQMLESMIEHAAPTRAEASDVATAIYQGADAVMLSAETAVGRHPATAVTIMGRIISAVERAPDYALSLKQYQGDPGPLKEVDVVATGVQGLAHAKEAGAVALRTGDFFRLAQFAKPRGATTILYASANHDRLRQAQLLWGVHPVHLDNPGLPDWPETLRSTAGLQGPVAYAKWCGDDRRFAWEVGVMGVDTRGG